MTDVSSEKPGALFRPLAVPQVDVRGFWGDRVDAVASRTADILYQRCIDAGMLDQIDSDRPLLTFLRTHPPCAALESCTVVRAIKDFLYLALPTGSGV